MRIRIYNASVWEPGSRSFQEGQELWIESDQIVRRGPGTDLAQEAKKLRFDEQIDARDKLVLPSFKNAHTHSAMTFLRSYADDLALQEWLEQQVFPMERLLDEEDCYVFAKLAMLEYLAGGIGLAFDMYLFPEATARAAVDMGLRCQICVAGTDEAMEKLEEQYQRFNHYHELLGCKLGFHAEYSSRRSWLEDLAGLANKYQAPVYTHCAETRREVEACLEREGQTPLAYLDELGMFRHGGGIFHGVHLTAEELERLARRQIWVVSNPASNAKLASGIAPLKDLAAAGVGLALGTDGPASNNALDFFREMYLASVGQKLRYGDAAALDAETVLDMACSGGARALGLADCVSLEQGQNADLIMIDLLAPNLQPAHAPAKNLVYAGQPGNVCLTMVAGQIRYRDGAFFVGEDPQAIYKEARRRFAALNERARKARLRS